MPSESPFQDKWALLIGASAYENVTPLQYADKDAEAFEAKLIEKLGFEKQKITVVADTRDDKPTHDTIFRVLAELTDKGIGKQDLLVFHFAGHGVRDDALDEDFVLPLGTHPDTIRDTGISIRKVVERLRATQCEHIVLMLDMCRNEMQAGARGVSSQPGTATRAIAKQHGLATFFSCEPKETSWEIEALGHGAFTHCLMKAIDDDDVSTVSQIGDFLRIQMPRINSEHKKFPQRPWLEVRPDEFRQLPVFYTGRSRVAWVRDRILDLWTTGELPDSVFEDALRVLDEGPDTAEDRALLKMLDMLCRNQIDSRQFEARWRRVARMTLGGTAMLDLPTFSGANGANGDPKHG